MEASSKALLLDQWESQGPVSQVGSPKTNFDSCVRLVEICVQEFYWGGVRINIYREVVPTEV